MKCSNNRLLIIYTYCRILWSRSLYITALSFFISIKPLQSGLFIYRI